MRTITILFTIITSAGLIMGQTTHEKKLINEIQNLTAELEENPYEANLYIQRANVIFSLNSIDPRQEYVPFELQDAIEDINVAISLDCENPLLYSLRAELRRDINMDYAGAIEDMNKAIALNPDRSTFYMQRANYKKLSEGCTDYQRCASMEDKRCKRIFAEACKPLVQ